MIKIPKLVMLDVFIIWASVSISYLIQFDSHSIELLILHSAVYSVFGVIFIYRFRLHNRVWRYASIGELVSVFKAVLLTSLFAYPTIFLVSGDVISFDKYLMIFYSLLLLQGGIRFLFRISRDGYSSKKAQIKVLIIGAGDCGSMVAKELRQNKATNNMYAMAFIDDDPGKHHHHIAGLPVLGGRDKIVEVVNTQGIDQIIIAIPTISRQEITAIIDICKQTQCVLKIIPKLDDLIQGKITVNEIRDVGVEDLLGRDPVNVDLQGIADYVEGKVVLVTGAGGSIGSELCRQIALFRPKSLLLLGHGENSIYSIEHELRSKFPDLETDPLIADVQDIRRIEAIFRTHRPQVVFHAAAHKHVPLMERNPEEAIKNNVFGSKNVAECADKFGAERFVLISTDKAVNPTSVMGATKRVAELFIQTLNTRSATKFAAVRFGNVLGSRGSVIPRFKQQIASGGPVTVTHPEMVRYFMTIPEAVQLVIQAGSMAQGGEVFILDMGKPVKIVDLAKDLIRLSGFEVETDIPITYTGIRPGEKLYEELLTNEEGLSATLHNRISISRPSELNQNAMELNLRRLESVLGTTETKLIREVLESIVPFYEIVC